MNIKMMLLDSFNSRNIIYHKLDRIINQIIIILFIFYVKLINIHIIIYIKNKTISKKNLLDLI